MELISNFLMAGGAFGAAIYCFVLSSRLKKFTTLESGMGGAIAVLSAQVDDMTKALDRARATAGNSASSLENLTIRAETIAGKLELLVASMHDLPDGDPQERPDRNEKSRAETDPEPGKLRFVRRKVVRENLEAAE